MKHIVVGFDKKEEAKKLGAKVIDGSWCIPDELPEENKSKLLALFGVESSSAKPAPQTKELNWEELLARDSIQILFALKKYGFPKDPLMRGRVFRRFNESREGDYPVSYEGLKSYCPEVNVLYPEEKITELVKLLSSGCYKREIEENKQLSLDEKGLLLFVLP